MTDISRFSRIPIPTLPGWRRHYDTYFYAGWRIQRNEVKHTYRVVSPTGRVWKRETEAQCMEIINERKERGLAPRNTHLVIIVPGLNNVLSTFSAIEKGLKDRGYETLLWRFASNRLDTRGHAERLRELINRLEGVEKISFVAHSLGGLIIRTLLSENSETDEWHKRIELGNIVNIASPHGGSFVADMVREQPYLDGLFNWVCGHVGHDLTTKGATELPVMDIPVGVIIGGTGKNWGLNPFSAQDNDIVVSKESAKVVLAVDFIQVKGSHTLMLWGKQTVKQTIHFIENACFFREEIN